MDGPTSHAAPSGIVASGPLTPAAPAVLGPRLPVGSGCAFTALGGGLADSGFTCNTAAAAAVSPAPAPALPTAAAVAADGVDTTAPVLRVDAAPSPSADRTPTVLLLNDDPTATTTCRVVGLRDWQPCETSPAGSPLALDLSEAPDGTYVVELRAVDPAGNAAQASAAYALDTTAPGPAVVAGPPSPGADQFPSWQLGALDPGLARACTLTGPGRSAQDVDCSAAEFTTGPLAPDGRWTLTVRLLDEAGNAGPAVAAPYVLDTTAPDLGELRAEQGVGGRTRAPSWSWVAAADTRTSCRVVLTDGSAVGPAPCTSPYVVRLASSAPDGPVRLQVSALDSAGNSSVPRVGGYLLDTSAPSAPAFASQPASPSSSTTPAWSLDAEPGAALRCQLRFEGGAVGPASACGRDTSSDLARAGRGEGVYALRVWAVDAAGNRSDAADSAPYEYHRSAAQRVVWTGGPEGPLSAVGGDWTFRSEAGATFSCRLLHGRTVLAPRSAVRRAVPRGGAGGRRGVHAPGLRHRARHHQHGPGRAPRDAGPRRPAGTAAEHGTAALRAPAPPRPGPGTPSRGSTSTAGSWRRGGPLRRGRTARAGVGRTPRGWPPRGPGTSRCGCATARDGSAR